MIHPLVWLFLLLGTVFAVTHGVAIYASLYWYFKWFDIVMHFWGGIMVALGLFAGARLFKREDPVTLVQVLTVLVFAMLSWELFERLVGLYNPDTYIYDTSKDTFFGLIGGLVGYFSLKRFRM